MKKIIYPIIIVLIIAAVAWIIVSRGQETPEETTPAEITEGTSNEQANPEQSGITEQASPEIASPETGEKLAANEILASGKVYKFSDAAQLTLAKQLRATIDAKNFEEFATVLREVYDKGWQNLDGFKALESEMYVYVTDTYFVKKNYSESLRLANIVFDKVFESWRFSYMKIASLKGLGDIEYAKGNYDAADRYAMEILAIEFRPEGADLHAQVNIAKAKLAKTAGNITEAKALLTDALRYELTAERKAEAEKLLAEL